MTKINEANWAWLLLEKVEEELRGREVLESKPKETLIFENG